MSALEAAPIETQLGTTAGGRARSRGGPSRGADRFAVFAVVLTGAIFGFFYAWVCSTMWGLDDVDPRVAIDAMQAMNASVRNAVFFPAFFLTPVLLGASAVLLHRTERPEASRWFGAAALVYLLGGLVLTMVVNVPMNEELAQVTGPLTEADAANVWADYSGPWQRWNAMRTVASGVALALAANGLRRTSRPTDLSPGRRTHQWGTRKSTSRPATFWPASSC